MSDELEGVGRKWSWPNRETIPSFVCGDQTEARNILVRVVGVPAEIRTGHFPNTSLERYL
jgi:hypothetical protein